MKTNMVVLKILYIQRGRIIHLILSLILFYFSYVQLIPTVVGESTNKTNQTNLIYIQNGDR